MKNTLHIVITGGHHNSALVVAKELMSNKVTVSWIGHRLASSGDQNDSAEYLEVKGAGITFYDLVAGKFSFHNGLINLLNIPLGIYRAAKYLRKLKPSAVISFGGYLGFAVGIAAYILRIPLFLHEQTVVSGLANKVLGKLAQQVFLTWESSLVHFKSAHTKVIGLPLRESLLNSPKKKLFPNHLPTILILGGKQGSHVINKIIFSNLNDILSSYNLIHQTGTNSFTGDYHVAISLKEALPPMLASRYQLAGYIGENEIGKILTSVDYYLGRSGAHITYELGVLGIPSVLIPYLHTTSREQLQNALVLEKSALAIILPESSLSYPHLKSALINVKKLTPHNIDLPRNAASVLVKLVLKEFA